MQNKKENKMGQCLHFVWLVKFRDGVFLEILPSTLAVVYNLTGKNSLDILLFLIFLCD